MASVSGELAAAGVPVERYLEPARLTSNVLAEPHGFVPGRSLWALAGLADEREGLGDFWIDHVRTGRWRRVGWVRPLTHATTLRDAIEAMRVSYPRHVPMDELGLGVERDVAWFWRRRVWDVRDWPGGDAAEQYTLSLMLEVIRAAAGPDWLPAHIQVECAPSGWIGRTRRLPGVRIECSRSLLAVAIPVPLLSLPLSLPAAAARAGEPALPPMDFQGSLRQVLDSESPGPLPGQETAAELLWTSARTLRRRLEEDCTSWHQLVDDIKFARAVERVERARELALSSGA
ncbi:MAG: AraC family transcriptional regulator ligand-binding domain-containing protein [Myxococcota bacterium]|nr:AraC family transcriptional regulator ligand-binding domain-containing protein [Myxococcota bacterium]